MVNTNLKSRLGVKVKAIAGTEAETSETALVPVGSDYLALTGNALNIIQENLKHQPLSLQFFDIIKSPSGGATVFSVPGLTGDEPAKELTGIILDYTTPRAYWDTPDPVEGTPPVCFSADSLISLEGKPCSKCPFNTFGSKGSETLEKFDLKVCMVLLPTGKV